MTLPDERYRAVLWAEKFLKDLCDSQKTPRVPKRIREQAYSILRHYPSEWHMTVVAEECPTVFAQRMEPLYRMVKQHEQDRKENDV